MSILAECAYCRRKQSVRNKRCVKCKADLDKQKRSRKVRFWINYRLPGGKQRREPVGYSIKEARDADGKRRGQKREGHIFDIKPNMTFDELTEWYLNLSSVKRLSSPERSRFALQNFNNLFGNKLVSSIKPVDLEDYQIRRADQGIANTTIDLEITIVKIMVNKAFDNDIIGGRAFKTFRRIKKVSSKSERTRDRVLTIEEYLRLIDVALPHLRGMLIIGYNTGMRPGEIVKLKWSYINRKAEFIRLPAETTKEKTPKTIPLNHHVKAVLENMTRHINHDFVFTYKGKPIKRFSGSDTIKTTCKKAGVPYGKKTKNGFTPHDLRRSFKTNCLKADVDKVYRDTITGHSLQGMDIHYIKPDESDLKKAMAKFTKWLDDSIKVLTKTLTKTV